MKNECFTLLQFFILFLKTKVRATILKRCRPEKPGISFVQLDIYAGCYWMCMNGWSLHVLRLNFTVNTMAEHFILIQYNRKDHFCFQVQILLQLDCNIFTLSLLSLMLTFNFSVGRFVLFLRVWAEAFAICGYAFPGFPHFTFVLVWKQIVNLYYSDCRALMCWHRQSYWNGAGIKPRLETECLSLFDFICRDTLYRDLSKPNDQELLTTFDNK